MMPYSLQAWGTSEILLMFNTSFNLFWIKRIIFNEFYDIVFLFVLSSVWWYLILQMLPHAASYYSIWEWAKERKKTICCCCCCCWKVSWTISETIMYPHINREFTDSGWYILLPNISPVWYPCLIINSPIISHFRFLPPIILKNGIVTTTEISAEAGIKLCLPYSEITIKSCRIPKKDRPLLFFHFRRFSTSLLT